MNELAKEIREILEGSNVNLGRKTERREDLIETIVSMVENYSEPTKKKGRNRLVTESGAAMMTQSESMRADEQMGRAPLGGGYDE